MIIAIDGPSGAGKSTVGKMLAKSLGLLYLDTGAMYRAVALAVIERGIALSDKAKIADVAREASISLVGETDSLTILLDGRDVSAEIRGAEIASVASAVSAISAVRRVMVDHQRQIGLADANGCVLEGRDIGTVVFPSADFKFFLTAAPEARAVRRFAEEKARGRSTTYEQTLAEISERDARDVAREDSPLSIADGAIVIDSSELDLRQVYEQMMATVNEARARHT